VQTEIERRKFLNRAMLGALSVFAVALGAGTIEELWPRPKGVFGTKFLAGFIDDIRETIREQKFFYNTAGRFYLVSYETSDSSNFYVQRGVASHGLLSIYQKCSHLGCRTPFCSTSGRFECPCHGAKFNYAGERLPGGPAPASLWHFPLEVRDNGSVYVDTSHPTAQTPAGFFTIDSTQTGPSCISD